MQWVVLALHRRHSGCLPMSCPATSILGVHGMVGTAICVQQWTSSHRAVLTCSNSTSSLHWCRCCAIWALMRACPCWVAASRALQHRASIHVQQHDQIQCWADGNSAGMLACVFSLCALTIFLLLQPHRTGCWCAGRRCPCLAAGPPCAPAPALHGANPPPPGQQQ